MKEFKITPITELTEEVVEQLVIHSTRSGIRRASAVKPFVAYPATDKVPALTYVVEDVTEEGEAICSIHALSTDVTKFILLQSVESSNNSESTEAPGDAEPVNPEDLPSDEGAEGGEGQGE